ncbi:MAG: hypothetical protein ACYC56_11650 [Candidatus Aquicultor sp.]
MKFYIFELYKYLDEKTLPRNQNIDYPVEFLQINDPNEPVNSMFYKVEIIGEKFLKVVLN